MLARRKISCFDDGVKSSLPKAALPHIFVGYSPAMLLSFCAAWRDQGLIFVVVIDRLRHDRGCSIGELNDGGHVQQVLVEARIEE